MTDAQKSSVTPKPFQKACYTRPIEEPRIFANLPEFCDWSYLIKTVTATPGIPVVDPTLSNVPCPCPKISTDKVLYQMSDDCCDFEIIDIVIPDPTPCRDDENPFVTLDNGAPQRMHVLVLLNYKKGDRLNFSPANTFTSKVKNQFNEYSVYAPVKNTTIYEPKDEDKYKDDPANVIRPAKYGNSYYAIIEVQLKVGKGGDPDMAPMSANHSAVSNAWAYKKTVPSIELESTVTCPSDEEDKNSKAGSKAVGEAESRAANSGGGTSGGNEKQNSICCDWQFDFNSQSISCPTGYNIETKSKNVGSKGNADAEIPPKAKIPVDLKREVDPTDPCSFILELSSEGASCAVTKPKGWVTITVDGEAQPAGYVKSLSKEEINKRLRDGYGVPEGVEKATRVHTIDQNNSCVEEVPMEIVIDGESLGLDIDVDACKGRPFAARLDFTKTPSLGNKKSGVWSLTMLPGRVRGPWPGMDQEIKFSDLVGPSGKLTWNSTAKSAAAVGKIFWLNYIFEEDKALNRYNRKWELLASPIADFEELQKWDLLYGAILLFKVVGTPEKPKIEQIRCENVSVGNLNAWPAFHAEIYGRPPTKLNGRLDILMRGGIARLSCEELGDNEDWQTLSKTTDHVIETTFWLSPGNQKLPVNQLFLIGRLKTDEGEGEGCESEWWVSSASPEISSSERIDFVVPLWARTSNYEVTQFHEGAFIAPRFVNIIDTDTENTTNTGGDN